MKIWNAIKKHIQLLARSKTSAAIVLLGPLIVVLVIGLSFFGSDNTVLDIGVFTPATTDLSTRYIEQLNDSETNLMIFEDSESCISGIKQGTILVCILFPENFELSDEKVNEVKFYVDETRTNLVYRLISKFAFDLDSESTEVQKELTGRMLEIMSKAKEEVTSSIASIISMKAKSGTMNAETSNSKTQLTSLDTGDVEVDLSSVVSSAQELKSDFSSLYSRANSVVDEGNAVIISATNVSSTFQTDLADLEILIDSLNTSNSQFSTLVANVEAANAAVESLKTKVKASDAAKTNVLSSLEKLSTNLNNVQSELDKIKTRQETVETELKSFKFSNAESIVNPISTSIETVSATGSRVTYSFPYLLMLIVMFVGLMLSSTLVLMEKKSRAYFRSFTVPVSDGFYILTTYLTSMLFLFVQTIFVMLLVKFGLGVDIFGNFLVTLVLILISMSLFVLLGMAIGHIFNTNEAITMSTITVGSVLLFLSNLILPLETLSKFIQSIVKLNPYVIASETMRKSTLFGLGFESLYTEIIILLGYIIIFLLITIVIKKASNSKYLMNIHTKFRSKIDAPSDKYLVIPELNITIRNLIELVNFLRSITDSQYLILTKEHQIFSKWVRTALKKNILANRIKNKPRTKVIAILEKYLIKRN